MARKRTLYRVWYKEKGTEPLMPSALAGIGKRERNKQIKAILEDGRFEIVAVTEETIK